MTTRKSIVAFVYGFKDKQYKDFLQNICENTSSELRLEIIDQHPLERQELFEEFRIKYEGQIRIAHRNVKWDNIAGPCHYKDEFLTNNMNSGEDYMLFVTPDIILNPGWDQQLIEYLESVPRESIISGIGKQSVVQPNLFDIKIEAESSDIFTTSYFIDRNFIFGKTSTFKKIRYPNFIKYAGENEILSLIFLSLDIGIINAPDTIIKDTMLRSIETMYACFSREHNYNKFVKIIEGEDKALMFGYGITTNGISKFILANKLDIKKINRLPYQTNDVLYDPDDLKFHNVDARRYVAGTKAIY